MLATKFHNPNPMGLVSTERGKKDVENRLSFEIGEMTLQTQKGV